MKKFVQMDLGLVWLRFMERSTEKLVKNETDAITTVRYEYYAIVEYDKMFNDEICAKQIIVVESSASVPNFPLTTSAQFGVRFRSTILLATFFSLDITNAIENQINYWIAQFE